MPIRPFLLLPVFAVLAYLLFFHRLGDRELWSSHEARAAQNAQYLLDGGDWRLPHLLDGRPELQKPPLYYWLTALIACCRGTVDEVTVRLPAAAGALLTALALFTFLRKQGRPRAGILAAFMLLTMVHFTWLGRVGRIDMPLTAATTWCIVSFLLGVTAPGRVRFIWLVLGYLSLAAGLMLKGPIAAVLAGGVLLCCCFQQPILRPLARSLGWGLPLIALLVLPWCWWVNEVTQGRFVQDFLLKHNVQRGLGGDDQLDAHVHPWWFYFIRVWLDCAPWSLLLPLAGWWAWKRRACDPLAWTGLMWFATILVGLSLLQYKRADYLLPAYPGLALLLGLVAEGWLAASESRRRFWIQRLGVGTVVVIVAGWFGYLTWILPAFEPQRSLSPFAMLVRQHLPCPGQVILFRVDSHHLNWELGKTVERIWEWENLAWWATRPAPVYVVMPKRFAEECAEHLQAGRLIPLSSTETLNGGRHDLPLVLFVNDVDHAIVHESR
jgi:4-amino-4-deoxy-L-arabinose transferase-like glycosyltransferase